MTNTIQNRIVHDEELIARLQRGDEWVFHLLVRRFREKIFSAAFGITLDAKQSQEITLEVFSEVYRTVGTIGQDTPLSIWLNRLAINRCRHWKRRIRRRWTSRKAVDTDMNVQAVIPAKDNSKEERTSADKEKRWLQMESAVRRLPDPIRTVFILRELVGLSHSSVAAVMGIKVGVVRSRLLDARRRIGKMLHMEFSELEKQADGLADDGCDEILIDRYLNADLKAEEKKKLKAHLVHCTRCRHYTVGLINFTRDLRRRVRNVIQELDMVGLEKQIIIESRIQHRSRGTISILMTSIRYLLLAMLAVGVLLLSAHYYLR